MNFIKVFALGGIMPCIMSFNPIINVSRRLSDIKQKIIVPMTAIPIIESNLIIEAFFMPKRKKRTRSSEKIKIRKNAPYKRYLAGDGSPAPVS